VGRRDRRPARPTTHERPDLDCAEEIGQLGLDRLRVEHVVVD
jgi:hypothetical protein